MIKRSLAILMLLSGVVLGACAAGNDNTAPASCGDGKRQSNELCEGADLGGQSCSTVGFSGGTLKCSGSCSFDTTGCCKDACPNLGDTMCDGDQVMTCGKGPSGCRAWVATTDCAAKKQTCGLTNGAAACKGTCTDACSPAGVMQCTGAQAETCSTLASGCLGWTTTTDCAASNQGCQLTGTKAACVACASNCKIGEQQCTGNLLQICSDSNGCPNWTTQTDCGATGLACVASGGVFSCKGNCTDKCGAGLKYCNGDILTACQVGTNGCTDWVQAQDCTQTQQICTSGVGGTKCAYDCSNPCTTLGATQCNANTMETCNKAGNCQIWQTTNTCPLGQACQDSGGSLTCVAGTPTGEDCGHVIPIKNGDNAINWTASKVDYMPATPSCSTYYNVIAPDVVLAYQSTITGSLEYSLPNPTSSTWVVMVNNGTCGNLSSNLSCQADWSSTLTDTIQVAAGQTYFFYVAPTDDLSYPLDNPFNIHLTEIDCTTFKATAQTLTPANGSTTTTLSPKLTVVFDVDISPSLGTVTITGDKGTNLSYNLATSTEINFPNADYKTMTITPAVAFQAGEHITVSFSGVVDSKCAKAATPGTWAFTVVTPPCAPGAGGMVGTTVSSVATGLSGLSVYYLAVDENPNGYVYVGGSSDLYRVTKAGAGGQYINALAGLSSTHLGYTMAIGGNGIFTVDSKYSGTAGYLWRISSDLGQTWSITDMATFGTAPSYYLDAAAYYKGRVYLASDPYSSTTGTQIWSVDATAATPPTAATLELTIPTETGCTGIAVDDGNYYLACDGDRVLRVARTGGAVTVLSDTLTFSSTANAVHAKDTNNDGTADFLYFKGGDETVFFVCSPTTTPYADKLVSYGTSTSSQYGMGFDATANKLYFFNDSTYKLTTVQ